MQALIDLIDRFRKKDKGPVATWRRRRQVGLLLGLELTTWNSIFASIVGCHRFLTQRPTSTLSFSMNCATPNAGAGILDLLFLGFLTQTDAFLDD